jgi:hypothetical protein
VKCAPGKEFDKFEQKVLLEVNAKRERETHLFFGITKSWCTIATFDMPYSTSYADPGLKMREHLCFRYCNFDIQ